MKHIIDTKQDEIPRRSILKRLWIALGGIVFFEFILIFISFFKPQDKKKSAISSSRMIRAGHIDAFEPGSVTAFVRGQFYLICHDDGGFLALSGKCTHLGCAVPWDKDKKKFICPCHASQFDITGNVLSSPAPRALDLFTITIVNKNIQVDTGNRIKRNRFNKNQLVYPETVTLLKKSDTHK